MVRSGGFLTFPHGPQRIVMIEKNYQPADIEHRMARIWEESGAFKAGRPERKDAAPFTIVIPR